MSESLKVPKSLYEPPYNSPIEDQFAYWVVKYLHEDAFLHPQYFCETISKNFRIDFVLTKGNRKVGIECDGSKYHKFSDDAIRDTLILGTRELEYIFRLIGKDIYYRINDCLFIIAKYIPEFFSERGLINLKTLANSSIKNTFIDTSLPFIHLKDESEKPIEEDDYSYIDDENQKEVDLWVEAKSFRNTNYYYYNCKIIWDIIKYHQMRDYKNILEYFSEIPKRINEHYDFVLKLSPREYYAYEQLMEAMNMLLMKKNK